MTLGFLTLLLVLGTIIGAAIQIKKLSNEVEVLKMALQTQPNNAQMQTNATPAAVSPSSTK